VDGDASLLWQILTEKGLLQLETRRPDEARASLDRAAAIVREIGVAEHPGTAELVEARRRAEE
jgi:hypothetical protein